MKHTHVHPPPPPPPGRLLPLSRLRRIVPGMGTFFTSLHLVQAFKEYDAVFSISKCGSFVCVSQCFSMCARVEFGAYLLSPLSCGRSGWASKVTLTRHRSSQAEGQGREQMCVRVWRGVGHVFTP